MCACVSTHVHSHLLVAKSAKMFSASLAQVIVVMERFFPPLQKYTIFSTPVDAALKKTEMDG